MSVYPYIPARDQKSPRRAPVQVVVIHTTESPLRHGAARGVAHYFQHPPRVGSSHYVVDADEVVQCVYDRSEAVGAPGANAFGLHVEHCGYARWVAEWSNPDAEKMLRLSASLVASKCREFDIPAVHLSPADLKQRGRKGICGHVDVTEAFAEGSHTDPGAGFPWGRYLKMISESMGVHTDPPGPQEEGARLIVNGKPAPGPLVSDGTGHLVLEVGGERMHIRNVCAGLGAGPPTWKPGPPQTVEIEVP